MRSVPGGPRALPTGLGGWALAAPPSTPAAPPPAWHPALRAHAAVRRAGTCSSGSRGRPRPAGSACAPCAAGSRAPGCRKHPPRPRRRARVRAGRPPQRGAGPQPFPHPTDREPGPACLRPQARLVGRPVLNCQPTESSGHPGTRGALWGHGGWGPRVTAPVWLRAALSGHLHLPRELFQPRPGPWPPSLPCHPGRLTARGAAGSRGSRRVPEGPGAGARARAAALRRGRGGSEPCPGRAGRGPDWLRGRGRAHLAGLGGGLDVRDAVAAGEVLGLPRLHGARGQVALVPNQHHGHVIRVLHPLDLLPARRKG